MILGRNVIAYVHCYLTALLKVWFCGERWTMQGFPSLLTEVSPEIWRFSLTVPCQKANKYTGARFLSMGRCQRDHQEPLHRICSPLAMPYLMSILTGTTGTKGVLFYPKKLLPKAEWEKDQKKARPCQPLPGCGSVTLEGTWQAPGTIQLCPDRNLSLWGSSIIIRILWEKRCWKRKLREIKGK